MAFSAGSARSRVPTAVHDFRPTVLGNWLIVGDYGSPKGVGVALSQTDAAQLIGKRVTYGPTRVVFADKRLDGPRYSQRLLTPDAFFQAWRVQPRSLGIFWQPIVEVDVTRGPSDFPGATLIIIDQDHLVAFDQGDPLRLERVHSQTGK